MPGGDDSPVIEQAVLVGHGRTPKPKRQSAEIQT